LLQVDELWIPEIKAEMANSSGNVSTRLYDLAAGLHRKLWIVFEILTIFQQKKES